MERETGRGGGCIVWIQKEKEQKETPLDISQLNAGSTASAPSPSSCLHGQMSTQTGFTRRTCRCVCVSCTCVRHSARGLLPSPACCGPGSVCLTPRTWPPPYPGNHMTEANVLSASLSGADERPAGDWSPARSSASALLARRHRASVIKPMSSGSSWSSRARDKAGETCQWLFVPN